MYHLDLLAGRERHADMIREAQDYRLARRVSKQAGHQSWFRHITNLLFHSNGQTDRNAPIRQGELAAAKLR